MTGVLDGVLHDPAPPPRPLRRRRRRWLAVAVAAVVVATGAVLVRQATDSSAPRCFPALKALAAEEVARLQVFDRWLARNHVAGYVGEVGWPGTGGDAQRWNAVGQAWFRAADRDGLWVTTWSAAEGWPADYPMGVYRLSGDGLAVNRAGPQTQVTERHLDLVTALRGIDVPSGAFGAFHAARHRYSDATPGRYGVAYYYPTPQQYRYLAARGNRLVRLGVTWERLQPRPFGPLDPVAVQRLRTTIGDARAAGLSVLVDLHDFGVYWHARRPGAVPVKWALGSRHLPTRALADLWGRLAGTLRDEPGVVGYDLMNEPGELAADPARGAAIWERASQQAVTAIRATGDTHVLAVEAYGSSGPEQFAQLHPKAWIDDPLGLTRYEVHQYFDVDGTGRYRLGLAADAAAARAAARASGTLTRLPDLACLPT